MRSAVLGMMVVGALWGAADFSGRYVAGDVVLTLQKGAGGKYSGSLRSGGMSHSLTAEERGGLLVGSYTVDGETLPFQASLREHTLSLVVEGQSVQLVRQGGATPVRSGGLRVNGQAIQPKDLQAFERQYQMRLPEGDFWYDKVSGAWGVLGGPTLGFTRAGLALGGPLRADASNGNTGVFINGRHLPMQDVLGLQALSVPVVQGRWWVDAAGNFGVEGHPAPLGNLFQFSRGRGGAYQRSTAGGYIGGDGSSSYFFDPKSGASVMVGRLPIP